MKNGAFIDKDYFEKLLEEIREIRLSERRFYQKRLLQKLYMIEQVLKKKIWDLHHGRIVQMEK